jgi:hypothetical protein
LINKDFIKSITDKEEDESKKDKGNYWMFLKHGDPP